MTKPKTRQLQLLAGVGYEKCGTTTLARHLEKDPRFAVPETKELFFFNQNYSESLQDYLDLFPSTSHTEFIVDVTPNYIRSAEALLRLKGIDLKKKIIVCLRDPIARAFSSYVHDIYYHHAHYDAVLEEYRTGELYEKVYSTTFEEELDNPHSSIRANYFEDLEFLYSIFDTDEILVLIVERDFATGMFAKKISDFLGLEIEDIAMKSENLGGLLPLVVRPQADLSLVDANSRQINLLKDNLYIFLKSRDGIAYWESIADREADRILQASYRWTTDVSAARASELRRWHFGEDVERIQEIIGYDVPEWKIDRPLRATKWFGIGPLRSLDRSVTTSVSVFGGNKSMLLRKPCRKEGVAA